jgi:PAS domain S-box-containing protein
MRHTVLHWNPDLHGEHSRVLRYGFSIICVAIALGLALVCHYYKFREVELPLLALSIGIVTWYAGVGPSALAVALSAAGFDYFFTEPIYSFAVSPRDLPYFLVFVGWALIVAGFAAVRRRTEESLRQARDRLQTEVDRRTQQARLLDQTHDTIFVRDMNDVITYWNRAAEEQYGWRSDQAIGNVTHDLLQTRFPEPLAEINRQLLRTDRWEGELVHTAQGGSRILVASRWSLQRDNAGAPFAILETNNDITERKRAEQAREETARRSERELREVIEAIPAIAFTTGPDGSNVWTNRRWVEYSGLSVEKTSGSGWESTIHPDDLDEHVAKWRQSVAGGQPFESEARHRSVKGEYRWFLVRAVPLRDDQGKTHKWYGTLTDIEDRKRVEKERERLHQLETNLAHLNRISMLGELAASLSHELKQPIAAAVMNGHACARWLRCDPPDLTEAGDAVSALIGDMRRAADIIDRVRSLYRLGTPVRELVDLNEIIREMGVLLRETANRNAVAVRMELDRALPTITADRVQLQQVLMNLMLNGIEAMKDRGGQLTVASERTEDDQLLISVSDSGIGLPADDAERIFETFFTTKPQGSGMGLAISQRIIQSHGGRLWASPNTGQGATFQFRLPKEEAPRT